MIMLFAGSCDDSSGSSTDAGVDADSDTTTNNTNNTNNTTATCDDGIRNQDEEGIDCGGSCPQADCCANGFTDPNLGEWAVDCGGSCAECFTGTVYFVANDGDDANDGLDGTPAHAWRTIAHVNEQSFSPGDAVLFKRGDEWRESLLISSSGTAEAHITFGAYGEGPRPRILGSERATSWTAVTGETNIWRSETVLAAPRQREGNSVTNHPASIFFGELDGTHTWGNMEELHLNSEGAPTDIYECDSEGAPFSLLDREYDWCWQDDHIYVYSPENPGDRYAFVEVPQRLSTIATADHPPQEYFSIDNLELMYAIKYGYDDGWPMNVVVRGLNITNCHIGYMGTKGAAAAYGLQIWHSDMLVQGNDIHDCGRRNISYNVYGDVRDESLVFENVIFLDNILHNGYHTTGFDISCGYTDTFRNFQFINNFIWDNLQDDPQNHPNDFTSMGIYLAGDTATFTDFLIYRNILKYIKQKAIIVGNVQNARIIHNTLYSMNHNAGGDYRGLITVSGEPANLRIENNIFFGDLPDSASFVLSMVTFSGNSHEGAMLNNNLFWLTNDAQRLVTTSIDSYTI
ncbi:hypothetical protein KKF84_22350, partial [Myxococcota bacterium]|nr:hypothetical protein [Myxococcota bacterium]